LSILFRLEMVKLRGVRSNALFVFFWFATVISVILKLSALFTQTQYSTL
jgi:hypothetical protein